MSHLTCHKESPNYRSGITFYFLSKILKTKLTQSSDRITCIHNIHYGICHMHVYSMIRQRALAVAHWNVERSDTAIAPRISTSRHANQRPRGAMRRIKLYDCIPEGYCRNTEGVRMGSRCDDRCRQYLTRSGIRLGLHERTECRYVGKCKMMYASQHHTVKLGMWHTTSSARRTGSRSLGAR